MDRMVVEAARGALAGAVGVVALDRVTVPLWEMESRRARAREYAVRPGGLDPAHYAAWRISRRFRRNARPRQPGPGGQAIHFALGVVPGALYALARNRWPAMRRGRGALFGLGLFLFQDELANRLLRLSGPPTAYPWQAHARGLLGHLAFGLATDAALRLVERRGRPVLPRREKRPYRGDVRHSSTTHATTTTTRSGGSPGVRVRD